MPFIKEIKMMKKILLLLFAILLMAIPALGWNTNQGFYLGVENDKSYWNLANPIYELVSGDTYAGRLPNLVGGMNMRGFTPVDIYDSSTGKEPVFFYDNDDKRIYAYDFSTHTTLEYFTTYETGINQMVITPFDGNIQLIEITNTTSGQKRFNVYGWNKTAQDIYKEGYFNFTDYFGMSNQDIMGNDVVCDLYATCYMLTNNFTFLVINMSNPAAPFPQQAKGVNNTATNCHDNDYMYLSQVTDVDGDTFPEAYIASNYDCYSTQYDFIRVDIYDDSITLSNSSTSGNLCSYTTAQNYDLYPKIINWDYDSIGGREVYAVCYNITANPTPYIIVFDELLTRNNYVAIVAGAGQGYHADCSGSGVKDVYAFITQPLPVDLTGDGQEEICIGEYKIVDASPLDLDLDLECYTGDLNSKTTSYEGSALVQLSQANCLGLSYPQDYYLSQYMEATDLNNDNKFEILWDKNIFYNLSGTTFLNSLYLGSAYNPSSSWNIIDGNRDGNYEIWSSNDTSVVTLYQNFTNTNAVLLGYLYDTGSPICTNVSRSYFTPAYNDTEGDLVYMRAYCASTRSYTNWTATTLTNLDSDYSKNVSCNSGTTIGTFTDSVCITDTAHAGQTGSCLDFTYDVADLNCFTKGRGSGYTYVNGSFTSYNNTAGASGAMENSVSDIFTGLGFKTTQSRMMLSGLILIVITAIAAKFGLAVVLVSDIIAFTILCFSGLLPIWMFIVLAIIIAGGIFLGFFRKSGSGGA